MQNPTIDHPWTLSTPSGGAELLVWFEPDATPPVLVCKVGTTILHYHLSCLDDVVDLLRKEGPMELGSKDEKQEAKDGTLEHWARSPNNPVDGWYGLKKGFRGRFANYVPPVLEKQGRVTFEKRGRSMWVLPTK